MVFEQKPATTRWPGRTHGKSLVTHRPLPVPDANFPKRRHWIAALHRTLDRLCCDCLFGLPFGGGKPSFP